MPRRDHHSPKIPIIDHHPRQRPAIAIEALQDAMARYGKPEIFNTD